VSRLGEELTAIINEVAGLCGAARNCGGDTGKRTIASVLLEASINLNLRHNGMFKCGGEVRGGYWWGNLQERNHLEDLDIDARIKTLKEIGW
jgi:hypothetical protein